MIKISLARRKVEDLKPHPGNSKIHSASQVEQIAKSISRFGFNDPIGIAPDGVLLEGEGRYQAAKKLGLAEVPVLVIEGLTERQQDLYRIAHNKIALTTGFDVEKLIESLRQITQAEITLDDMGFTEQSSKAILTAFASATGIERSARLSALGYDLIWQSKEQKATWGAFAKKLQAQFPELSPAEALLRFVDGTGVIQGNGPATEEGSHEVL